MGELTTIMARDGHEFQAYLTAPLADVEKVKAADPKGVFYEYEAGHGFSCDQRPSFSPEAAALARQRTLNFFGRNLAGKKA
jgi:dienelactone hydrolase